MNQNDITLEMVVSKPNDGSNSENASFYTLFQIGNQSYAAVKPENGLALLKVVVTSGEEQLHDIEDQVEFEAVEEFFLQQVLKQMKKT